MLLLCRLCRHMHVQSQLSLQALKALQVSADGSVSTLSVAAVQQAITATEGALQHTAMPQMHAVNGELSPSVGVSNAGSKCVVSKQHSHSPVRCHTPSTVDSGSRSQSPSARFTRLHSCLDREVHTAERIDARMMAGSPLLTPRRTVNLQCDRNPGGRRNAQDAPYHPLAMDYPPFTQGAGA
jgi:hypothetical protein